MRPRSAPAAPSSRGRIEAVLPPAAVAVERFDDADPVWLFPSEAAVVAGAVEKRRKEFATVRLCAREALARLGVAATPLVPGERGAPAWPPGVVGSMTHCDGYRAAAVAPAAQVAALGIDAEPDLPLPEGVLDMVASPAEVAAFPAVAGPQWGRLLFCAKEALYKAWFPLTGRWLGFEEARVDLAVDGTFSAGVLTNGAALGDRVLTRFTGRWHAADGLLLATVAVPS
ncbi:4'-phosphopantetheinyl transferase family protein [Asanoa siamensis]|uniref:4'-phosphopantetheinyl transferase n=1 Tax=Asanoa siamensis TaxID=926357 RepID=A0ABQ4CSI5_9ACTN|nr:4'-phosphopantetheinyl transferase superfamily protein [Asanoa siamensis]GIF74245.1 4'-phosphopantetheinyl transferase [Asanoa siamensis]